MTIHTPALSGMPLETKSEAEGHEAPAGDVAEAVAAALEGLRTDVIARLEKLETKAEDTSRRLARPAILTAPSAPEDTAAIEKKAFNTFLRSRGQDDTELKALTIAAPGAGAVLAPPTIGAGVIERLVEFSPVRAVASKITMGGSELELLRLKDEVEPGMVAETGPRPEDEPSFDKISLKPFEMSVIVPVSKSLLEDSSIDLGGFVSAHLAKKFGQKEARQFVVGTGVGEAEGVLTSADIASLTSAASGKVGVDDLLDLYASIPSFYAARGSWLMNRKTIAAVRKLRNSAGDLIWNSDLSTGSPGSLLGRPVYEAPDCPDIAAGASPIVFGDFAEGYTIGDRIGLEFEFDTLTGWASGITKILARRRVGGRVVLGEALTKLKVKA